jgi:hypothetical protein
MSFIFSILSILLSLFITIIAGTLMGGVVGWTVNLAFPVVADTLNALSGLKLDAFDQGAVLGFVGGFIKSTSK